MMRFGISSIEATASFHAGFLVEGQTTMRPCSGLMDLDHRHTAGPPFPSVKGWLAGMLASVPLAWLPTGTGYVVGKECQGKAGTLAVRRTHYGTLTDPLA